jgi:hypothetical protein
MVKASLRILKSLLCQSLSISLQKILWETSVFHLFCLCFLIKIYISLDPLYTRTQTNSRLFHHLRLNAVCCGSREQINTKAEAAHSRLEERKRARERTKQKAALCERAPHQINLSLLLFLVFCGVFCFLNSRSLFLSP